ncbi:hypothetical protein WH47_10039, partial [Habropoda laboriosa]
LAIGAYHLFRSLQNLSNGRDFKNTDRFKLTLDQFFNPKDKNFFERTIQKLPAKWQMVSVILHLLLHYTRHV